MCAPHDLPTPRELLIALHADQRLTRQELGDLAVEVTGWARGRPAAAEMPAPLARLARKGSQGESAAATRPAWSTPSGATAAAAAQIAAGAACGARVITLLDPEYPEILAGMALPPPVLAIRGRLPPGPAVAIVGSRRADGYGLEVAAHFARCLAAAGVVVVSGMAHGIDAAAHQGALAMPQGRTVAVLGCGVGFDYPRGHTRLADAIAARGALVSEFPCDARPQPWHFPVRNRTIAGLAAVTLVVQATPRSGALDTARHASRLGRPVYAVPGPVFAPLSWGPHSLLRSGARLASHPQDILDVLFAGAAGAAEAETRPDAAGGHPVLAALRPRAAHSAEQVAASTGLEPGTVLAALLELEIAGRVERLRGSAWRLAKVPRVARDLSCSPAGPVVLSALRAVPPSTPEIRRAPRGVAKHRG
jgi:DNA processing protein